jgi:hypothetical protein
MKEQLQEWFWAIVSVLTLLLISVFVRPLTRFQDHGSYWDGLKESVKPPVRPAPTTIQFAPWTMNVILILVIFGWIWLGTYFAYQGGKKQAELQKVFSVVNQYPGTSELIVFRTYGDYFIAAPFNRSTREVEKTFYLLELSKLEKIPLTLEKIGPLKVKESLNTVP